MASTTWPSKRKLRARHGLIDAGDDLDQRALAAAVLAGDALHFAGQDFEVDILQRFDAAERDAYVAKRQDRRQVLGRGRRQRSWHGALGKRGKSDTPGRNTTSPRASQSSPL